MTDLEYRPAVADPFRMPGIVRHPAKLMRTWIPVCLLILACSAPDHGDGADADSIETSGVTPPALTSFDELPGTPLAREDRAAWRAALQWSDDCEEAFQLTNAANTAGLFVHGLAEGIRLVEVHCAAGAYQPSMLFIRLDQNPSPPVVTTLTFTTYDSPDGESLERAESTELWGEATVLPDRRELTLLSVSRQTRDCGTWSRYTLAAERPRLLELYAQIVCPAEQGPPADPAPGRPPQGWLRIPTN
jgi:hypothetical protein